MDATGPAGRQAYDRVRVRDADREPANPRRARRSSVQPDGSPQAGLRRPSPRGRELDRRCSSSSIAGLAPGPRAPTGRGAGAGMTRAVLAGLVQPNAATAVGPRCRPGSRRRPRSSSRARCSGSAQAARLHPPRGLGWPWCTRGTDAFGIDVEPERCCSTAPARLHAGRSYGRGAALRLRRCADRSSAVCEPKPVQRPGPPVMIGASARASALRIVRPARRHLGQPRPAAPSGLRRRTPRSTSVAPPWPRPAEITRSAQVVSTAQEPPPELRSRVFPDSRDA